MELWPVTASAAWLAIESLKTNLQRPIPIHLSIFSKTRLPAILRVGNPAELFGPFQDTEIVSGTNIVGYEIPLNAFTSRNVTIPATLYYQSIPPYYLHDRFALAPNAPATQRLYYLTSNLQTRGTPIEDWKLRIASASEVATLR